jgi:nucleoid DNA-binding protein
MKRIIFAAVFGLLICQSNVQADIFKYVDENDIVHFTDRPTPRFTIQLGPFTRAKADRCSKKLKDLGHSANSIKSGKDVYLVRFGNFSTQSQAKAEAQELVANKIISTYKLYENKEAKPFKRVEIYGEPSKPPDSSRLTGEARTIEIYLNSKAFKIILSKALAEYQTAGDNLSRIQMNNFYSVCSDNNGIVPIVCSLNFPGDYPVGPTLPLRYLHFIEKVTRDVARSFIKSSTTDYEIIGQYQLYMVCRFTYSHYFDRLDAFYGGHG